MLGVFLPTGAFVGKIFPLPRDNKLVIIDKWGCPIRIFTTENTEFHGEKGKKHIKTP
jgi:hypothetical protein